MRPFRRRLCLCPALALAVFLALPLIPPTVNAACAEALPALSAMDPAIVAAVQANAEAQGLPADTAASGTGQSLTESLQAIKTLTLPADQPVRDVSAVASLPSLQNLTIEGGTMTTLAGLANHPSLQSLTLKDCPALNLGPLATCKRLTSVTLEWSERYAGQGAYDLSTLADCPRLNTLTLSGACVNDLTALSDLSRLTSLTIVNVSAEDYAPIAKLTGLTGLRLYGAPGAQVASAFSGLGKKLTGAYLGDCSLTPEANDALLKCTRLKSLGFERVEGVDSAASGWPKLQSLSCLHMSGGALADFGFLGGYVSTVGVKLENVAVGPDKISCSVDFDKYFIRLDNVPADNAIQILMGDKRQWDYATLRTNGATVSPKVIAAFAGMGGLLSLDVQAVSPDAFATETWTGFPALQQLKLTDCENADLNILFQLPALNRLSLTRVTAQNETAIAAVRKLRMLTLIGCQVSDWSFLMDMASAGSLTALTIADCNGPDSSAFAAKLPKLQTLALEGAPVPDLTALSGCGQLTTLCLYGCPITDYAPLATLPGLTLLTCNEDAALPKLDCRVERRRYVAAP